MNKSELIKISRDFRDYSSRLLTTNDEYGLTDTKRLINFINTTEILKKYIDKCLEKYNIDIESIRNSLNYHEKYPLPVDIDEEVAFTYSLLLYGIENFGGYWAFANNGYGLSSRKIQDQIDAFNDQVVRHFVNNINKYLENLIIDCRDDFNVVEENKEHFISYCWADKDIADMIDNDFKNIYGITLTRDERDLKFKRSIKDFMNSLNDHDFVIMIISDSYIKSHNCMYEVMEVMRDRRYKEKIYCIILSETDKKYYTEESLNKMKEKGQMVAANIYNVLERVKYTGYWQNERDELESAIASLDDLNKIPYLQELKQIGNIVGDIGDFLTTISDLKNESLEELKNSNYEAFIKEMGLNKI